MDMIPMPKRQRGFTLIELLVVIAIIALLLAILVPSLSQARNLARMAKCGANNHAVGRAVHMYMNQAGANEPWWFDGGHDLGWETVWTADLTSPTPQSPITWGNPAVALTRDFRNTGRSSDNFTPTANSQDFLSDASIFFCPLMPFSYEKHYRRYGHARTYSYDSSVMLWGTYAWMWPKKVNSWYTTSSGKAVRKADKDITYRPYNNPASDNVLMLDYFSYDWSPDWWSDKSLAQLRYGYYHWHALMLDGSVQRRMSLKDTFEWLWTDQPSDPRQYRDVTHPAQILTLPSYVPK